MKHPSNKTLIIVAVFGVIVIGVTAIAIFGKKDTAVPVDVPSSTESTTTTKSNVKVPNIIVETDNGRSATDNHNHITIDLGVTGNTSFSYPNKGEISAPPVNTIKTTTTKTNKASTTTTTTTAKTTATSTTTTKYEPWNYPYDTKYIYNEIKQYSISKGFVWDDTLDFENAYWGKPISTVVLNEKTLKEELYEIVDSFVGSQFTKMNLYFKPEPYSDGHYIVYCMVVE